MARAPVDIYNQALLAIGQGETIAAVDENSRPAVLMTQVYADVRDEVLRAAHWSCATAHARLGLLATRNTAASWAPGDPAPGWAYAFGYPSDMLVPRYMSDYSRFDLGLVNATPAIMSNNQTPILTYTMRQTNVGLWDANLVAAISYMLASRVCISLTGKRQRARDTFEYARGLVNDAKSINANQDDGHVESIPEWLQVRGVGAQNSQEKFIYPVGLLTDPTGMSVSVS